MQERVSPKRNALGGTCRTLALGFGLAASALSGASEAPVLPEESRWAFHAFGTLGLGRSTDGSTEYVRDASQPRGYGHAWSTRTDSVLGVQANVLLGHATEGVVQVISRYRYNQNFDPEVAWAFLSHEIQPGLKVRAGRLGTEFYMLSDSRLIGYSNTAIRPPPDFFGPLIMSYFDGADFSASTSFFSGVLHGKVFYGHSPEVSPFFGDINWDIGGSRMRGAYLDYAHGPWQFRLTHAEVKFGHHEIPINELVAPALIPMFAPFTPPNLTATVPELSTVGKTSRFSSLGVLYDDGPFRLQAMYGRIQHETRAYENSWSGYVLASYRIGQTTPYVGYSTVKSKPRGLSDPPPIPLDQIAASVLAFPHMNRHTISFGTRWDFRENWALKAQLDLVRGDPNTYFLFRGDGSQWSGHMQIMSLALDFAF